MIWIGNFLLMLDRTLRLARTCLDKTMTSEDTHRVGTLFDGEYRLEGVLGRGAMGVVYQVTQMGSDSGQQLDIGSWPSTECPRRLRQSGSVGKVRPWPA